MISPSFVRTSHLGRHGIVLSPQSPGFADSQRCMSRRIGHSNGINYEVVCWCFQLGEAPGTKHGMGTIWSFFPLLHYDIAWFLHHQHHVNQGWGSLKGMVKPLRVITSLIGSTLPLFHVGNCQSVPGRRGSLRSFEWCFTLAPACGKAQKVVELSLQTGNTDLDINAPLSSSAIQTPRALLGSFLEAVRIAQTFTRMILVWVRDVAWLLLLLIIIGIRNPMLKVYLPESHNIARRVLDLGHQLGGVFAGWWGWFFQGLLSTWNSGI